MREARDYLGVPEVHGAGRPVSELAELHKINERADLATRHPDALPWPSRIWSGELDFYARLCGYPAGGRGRTEARAYIAKELAQLADIERHVSIVLGLISGLVETSPRLQGVGMVNALMHFAAEEYQHSNMFYRYVELVAGRTLDRSHESMDGRVRLFMGPESVESKLTALLGSAYPGETVITIFEHRLRKLDPRQRFFLTQMIHLHGLDEARHIELDHFVFERILPELSNAELFDAQRLYGRLMAYNHELGGRYAELVSGHFGVDFTAGNEAARVQAAFTQTFARVTLSGRSFPRADEALSRGEREDLAAFAGVTAIHPQGVEPCA